MIEVVSQLPTRNISETTVYLVPSQNEEDDVCKEYICVNNDWKLLGIQKVDLNNYYDKSEINSLLSNKVSNSTLINDYYNKNSINSLLANKADKVTIEIGHPSIVLTNRSDGGSATNPTYYTTIYRYGHYKREKLPLLKKGVNMEQQKKNLNLLRQILTMQKNLT